MPFLELSLHCREADLHRCETALEDIGALSVTLSDADACTPNERAVLEPGVGETPLWPLLTVAALFPAGADGEALLAALEAFDPELDLASASFARVEDQDWERAWLDRFQPMRFGTRTWIVPWNHAIPAEARHPDAAIVRLDPGLAFGSGTHPTTALCLEWLDGLDLRGKTVLDYGCGSGILALAALALGAARVVAVDNDPQALIATGENAERNGLAGRLKACLPQDLLAARFPVVVANILAAALDALAETLAARVAPGGVIALSGILRGQEGELLRRYGEWFENLAVTTREDWVCISGSLREKPAVAAKD